jgi:hypothetical protein
MLSNSKPGAKRIKFFDKEKYGQVAFTFGRLKVKQRLPGNL